MGPMDICGMIFNLFYHHPFQNPFKNLFVAAFHSKNFKNFIQDTKLSFVIQFKSL